jgi:hypothetical protein
MDHGDGRTPPSSERERAREEITVAREKMIAKIGDKLFCKIEQHLIFFRTMVVVVAAIAAAVSSVRMSQHPFSDGDFGVYLHAARLMRSGQNIYAIPHPVAGGSLFYIYPPFLAFLFVPLSYIPEKLSIVLWTVLNIALIAWIVPTAFEIISGTRFSALAVKTRWAVGFFSLLLTGRFIQQHLDRGQMNILEMGLLVLGIKLMVQGERRRAYGGVIIGLSVALKLITAPYAVWLTLERQAKALAGAAIGLAIGLLSPALLMGWRANWSSLSFWFRHFVLDSSQREANLALGYDYSIRGLLLRLFTPAVAFEHAGQAYRFMIVHAPLRWIDAADWALRLGILGVVIAYWFRFRDSAEPVVRGGGIALTFAAIPLLFPTAQQHYFVFLLPTAIYLVYCRIVLKMSEPWFSGWIAGYFLLAVMTARSICGKSIFDFSVAFGCVPLGTICLMFAVFRASVVKQDKVLVLEKRPAI